MKNIVVRSAMPSDCEAIQAIASDWWGRPIESDMFSRSFLTHFSETSLIAEHNSEMVGFLIGFLSQSRSEEAYIRFIVVNPGTRGIGVGRALYEHFFAVISLHGRRTVRSVTSPNNKASIAFHLRMGFTVEPQEHKVDEIPVVRNYHGRKGTDRVLFIKR